MRKSPAACRPAVGRYLGCLTWVSPKSAGWNTQSPCPSAKSQDPLIGQQVFWAVWAAVLRFLCRSISDCMETSCCHHRSAKPSVRESPTFLRVPMVSFGSYIDMLKLISVQHCEAASDGSLGEGNNSTRLLVLFQDQS